MHITVANEFDTLPSLGGTHGWIAFMEEAASGMNQTLGTVVSAQNTAQNGHYRRTQAYDFHH